MPAPPFPARADTPARTIMVINPNTTAEMTEAVVRAAQRVAAPGTVVVGGTPDSGMPSSRATSTRCGARWGCSSRCAPARR